MSKRKIKKIEILKGLPASGKSTYARKVVENYQGTNDEYLRINKDDLRAMLFNSQHSKGREKFVLDLRDSVISSAMEKGYNIIVDDTNLHSKHEERIKQIVKSWNAFVTEKTREYDYVYEIIINDSFLDVSLDECIINDLKRENRVGIKVIHRMYNQYIVPQLIKKQLETTYNENDSLKNAIIIDIDGTVALNMGNRSPYDMSKVTLDIPNPSVVWLIKSLIKNNDIVPVFVSGRTSDALEDTRYWIKTELGIKYFDIFMRAEGDQRKDSTVKTEIYERFIKGFYNVKFVLDDRNQTVEAWRQLGLPCFQVNYGFF